MLVSKSLFHPLIRETITFSAKQGLATEIKEVQAGASKAVHDSSSVGELGSAVSKLAHFKRGVFFEWSRSTKGYR